MKKYLVLIIVLFIINSSIYSQEDINKRIDEISKLLGDRIQKLEDEDSNIEAPVTIIEESSLLFTTYELKDSWAYIYRLNNLLSNKSYIVGAGTRFRILSSFLYKGEIWYEIMFTKVESVPAIEKETIQNSRNAKGDNITLSNIVNVDRKNQIKDESSDDSSTPGTNLTYVIKKSDFTGGSGNAVSAYFIRNSVTWGPIVVPFKLYLDNGLSFKGNSTVGYSVAYSKSVMKRSASLSIPASIGFLIAPEDFSSGLSIFSGIVFGFSGSDLQFGILGGGDLIFNDSLDNPFKPWVSIGLGYQFMNKPLGSN